MRVAPITSLVMTGELLQELRQRRLKPCWVGFLRIDRIGDLPVPNRPFGFRVERIERDLAFVINVGVVIAVVVPRIDIDLLPLAERKRHRQPTGADPRSPPRTRPRWPVN